MISVKERNIRMQILEKRILDGYIKNSNHSNVLKLLHIFEIYGFEDILFYSKEVKY